MYYAFYKTYRRSSWISFFLQEGNQMIERRKDKKEKERKKREHTRERSCSRERGNQRKETILRCLERLFLSRRLSGFRHGSETRIFVDSSIETFYARRINKKETKSRKRKKVSFATN